MVIPVRPDTGEGGGHRVRPGEDVRQRRREDGAPNTELPLTTVQVTIQDIGGGKTRMSIESVFPSAEAMEQLAAMGMEEGLTQAVGQIDAILAADPKEE